MTNLLPLPLCVSGIHFGLFPAAGETSWKLGDRCNQGGDRGKGNMAGFNSTLHMFHFQFMEPISSFSVGYKSESNDANDSKKEDLSQLFDI